MQVTAGLQRILALLRASRPVQTAAQAARQPAASPATSPSLWGAYPLIHSGQHNSRQLAGKLPCRGPVQPPPPPLPPGAAPACRLPRPSSDRCPQALWLPQRSSMTIHDAVSPEYLPPEAKGACTPPVGFGSRAACPHCPSPAAALVGPPPAPCTQHTQRTALRPIHAGLVFDLDGTLLDTMPTHWRAWRQLAAEQRFELSVDTLLSLAGKPSTEILDILCREQARLVHSSPRGAELWAGCSGLRGAGAPGGVQRASVSKAAVGGRGRPLQGAGPVRAARLASAEMEQGACGWTRTSPGRARPGSARAGANAWAGRGQAMGRPSDPAARGCRSLSQGLTHIDIPAAAARKTEIYLGMEVRFCLGASDALRLRLVEGGTETRLGPEARLGTPAAAGRRREAAARAGGLEGRPARAALRGVPPPGPTWHLRLPRPRRATPRSSSPSWPSRTPPRPGVRCPAALRRARRAGLLGRHVLLVMQPAACRAAGAAALACASRA